MGKMDEVFAMGAMDQFLKAAKKVCESKVRGKKFNCMEEDDVVQEILIRVYKSVEKYDPEKASASTFFSRVMDTELLSYYRKSNAEKNKSLANAAQITDYYEEGTDAVEAECDPTEYSVSEFYIDFMYNIGLTDKEKHVFKMRYEGFDYTEIADSLGVSKPYVSQLWKSIMTKYRNCTAENF